jgi:hypothetical protein
VDLYDHDREYDNEIMLDEFKIFMLMYGKTLKGGELNEGI